MKGDKNVGDGDIRRDFPGGWKGDANNAFTADGRTKEQQQFFDFTAKLFNWRKGKSVIHIGKTTHYIPENNVYTYFRFNDAESVMVIINNSDEKQEVAVSRFKENTQQYTTGKDVISGQTINIKNNISIEAHSALILELK
jgi:hypothetical protein